VTSNAAAGRFMAGPGIACNDPNTVAVELHHNGEVINAATSGDIGDQRELAVWLVNQALRQGYEVYSGMLVMTGAIGQILPAKPGHYEAKFGEFGSFSFDLS
jgi:2-keto-4-pentenoate hydratase